MTDSSSGQSAPPLQAEELNFSAEVERLLDLVVHALYSDREIFLRELVANAADAMDRRRFESLTDPSVTLPDDARIYIRVDEKARLLTISDDGIGMSRAEMVQNLGTIARSGTRAFSESIKEARAENTPSLIGQFGVGFYSAFMVAEHVDVVSRRAGSEEAWKWSSKGRGSYSLSPAQREKTGTDITLHIKADADDFLKTFHLETIIRKWADNISWPVVIQSGEEEITANRGTALWLKPKADIPEDQLVDFYRHVSHQFDKPWATLHWKAEGTLEFAALLFIPGTRPPFEPMDAKRESPVRLHVRRMFITDSAELLPPWLRFVSGVVDTEDLPLNVSREMLQTTPVLARIRKAVTSRVMSELAQKAKDTETYIPFWENFGPILKEGLWEDATRREDIAQLARFRSTTQEGWTTLDAYVERMPQHQEAIYYLTGDNERNMASSPHLEAFREKGIEVLLLSDPVDSFWPERFGKFKEKPFKNVTQRLPSGADEAESPKPEGAEKLVEGLKSALGESVSEIRLSNRLVKSAVILTTPEHGMDTQLLRLMRRSGQDIPAPAPILEINPRHELMLGLMKKAHDGESLKEAAHILLDLARIQEGELPSDPAAFAANITTMLGKAV